MPGVHLPLRTKEQWIVDRLGRRVRLASVNWFGAESAEPARRSSAGPTAPAYNMAKPRAVSRTSAWPPGSNRP